MNRKGFTLLELLVVVMIISILVATALPNYIAAIEKARSAEATIMVGALRGSMLRHWYGQKGLANTYTPATLDTLDIGNPHANPDLFYAYSLTDKSTLDTRNYIIRAERRGKETEYWVQWVQLDNNTGMLYRSKGLGGPES